MHQTNKTTYKLEIGFQTSTKIIITSLRYLIVIVSGIEIKILVKTLASNLSQISRLISSLKMDLAIRTNKTTPSHRFRLIIITISMEIYMAIRAKRTTSRHRTRIIRINSIKIQSVNSRTSSHRSRTISSLKIQSVNSRTSSHRPRTISSPQIFNS